MANEAMKAAQLARQSAEARAAASRRAAEAAEAQTNGVMALPAPDVHGNIPGPSPYGAGGVSGGGAVEGSLRQGLTLVHFLAQRKQHCVGYVRCMIFPLSITPGDTGRCDQNGLG